MILAWTAWFGIYLLIQGVYVFRRGVVAPFFFETKGTQSLPSLSKLMAGLVHFGPGLWLIGLVGRSMWHTRGTFEGGDIAITTGMIAAGVLAFIRPITPLEWVKRAHPDLPLDNTFLLAMARVIGAVLMFIGLVFVVNR
jgi:hypothetical protein